MARHLLGRAGRAHAAGSDPCHRSLSRQLTWWPRWFIIIQWVRTQSVVLRTADRNTARMIQSSSSLSAELTPRTCSALCVRTILGHPALPPNHPPAASSSTPRRHRPRVLSRRSISPITPPLPPSPALLLVILRNFPHPHTTHHPHPHMQSAVDGHHERPHSPRWP